MTGCAANTPILSRLSIKLRLKRRTSILNRNLFLRGVVVCTLSIGICGCSNAGEPAEPERAATCDDIASGDFSTIADAPTQIISSRLVEADDVRPSYCDIQGYVTPNVGFELRLPISAWNEKFFAAGCGGFCGTTKDSMGLCRDALRRGYACITSDMGHTSTGGDAKWAYNNIQAEIDFGYRATHVVALAGKAIAQQYYGVSPRYSYFMGCSTGGRQGLIEAQRFPRDFDGIIAGAPPLNYTMNSMNLLWYGLAAVNDGGATLDEAALQLAHTSALSQCDADDGIQDGVIGNPPACSFDPAELQCESDEKNSCLTSSEILAMQKIYSGATTSSGETLYFGAMPGSELNWLNTIIGRNGGPPSILKSRVEQFRFMFMWPDPGPSWQPRDFDFDSDYRRLGMKEALYSAANPDLRLFKKGGGKLILYQGWNDELAVPMSSVDYYETVENTMGGRAQTQDFFRLFMLPGANHCWGGDGAYAVDYIGYMEAWVERGFAPEKIVGAHLNTDSFVSINFSGDESAIEFTRPVYAYPLRAKYKGSGDPNNADNFVPVEDGLE